MSGRWTTGMPRTGARSVAGKLCRTSREGEATMATEIRLTFENLEAIILGEIADRAMTQRDVAQTYAIMIRQCGPDGADWARINRAIMDRWSGSGLVRFKQLALKAVLRGAGGAESRWRDEGGRAD